MKVMLDPRALRKQNVNFSTGYRASQKKGPSGTHGIYLYIYIYIHGLERAPSVPNKLKSTMEDLGDV